MFLYKHAFKFAGIITIVLLSIMSHGHLYGQCPASIPNLNTYETGTAAITYLDRCLPQKIKITNTTIGATNTRNFYAYTGGPLPLFNFTQDDTHTYTSPGTYTIVQYSEKGGRPILSCSQITVEDTLAPTASLLTCSDGSVKINFDSNQPTKYEKYIIAWGDGDIDEIFAGYRSATHHYATRATYLIKARGVNSSTGCQGAVGEFLYQPGSHSFSPPTLEKIEVADSKTTTISLVNPAQTALNLWKKINNGTYQHTSIITQNQHDLIEIDTDSVNTVCYQLQATDNCLSDYISNPVCTIPFSLQEQPQANELKWQKTEDSDAVINLKKDGATWKTISGSTSSSDYSLTDSNLMCGQTHCYQLTISYSTGGEFRSQIKCRKTPGGVCGLDAPLFIPNVFTPNGDNNNDTFVIKGMLTVNFDITIYNRWGTPVFHSNDQSTSWDGTYKGQPASPGQYTYAIRLSDAAGTQLQKNGTLLLLR